FDPTPDDTRCGLVLADNGTVAGVGHDFLIDFSSDLMSAEIREYADLYIRNIGISADSRIIVLENVIDRPREIMAFDWDGRLLWTVDIGDKTVVCPIAVSMDGSLSAVTFASDGFILMDGATGEVLAEQYPGCQASYVSISADGSHLAFPTALQIGDRPYNMVLTHTEELNRSGTGQEFLPEEGYRYNPSDVNNTGYCLFSIFRIGASDYTKLGLIDSDGDLIWCSRVMNGLNREFSIAPNYYNIEIKLRSILRIITPSGSIFIYMDSETGNIHINSIERRFQ
ncbi:MAG: hypothetical protein KAW14_12210, partial [Candidatus Aegiribacteria sp.]|nr:hypothetical protein [Candidatus Aegiribacteria sp.]